MTALTLLLLLIALIPLVHLSVRRASRAAVRRAARYATGLGASVGRLRLAPSTGRLSVSDLTLANPAAEPPFQGPHFLKLGRGRFTVAWTSLLTRTVRLPEVTLDELTLHLERRPGGANYRPVLDRLERVLGPPVTAGPASSGEPASARGTKRPARKFLIGRLQVQRVHVSLAGVPGGPYQLNLPPIELHEVGSESDRGALASDVAAIILRHVIHTALRELIQRGTLPGRLGRLQSFGREVLASWRQAATDRAEHGGKHPFDRLRQHMANRRKRKQSSGEESRRLEPGDRD